MIIDFHVHTFPAEIRDHRENFFDGEPEFKLLYESPKSKLVSAENIVAMMDEQEVDLSVVFGFPWRNPETCRLNNDYVIDAVSRHPDRLRGMCCVDSLNPDAAEEVQRCLDAGLSGVGELAFYGCGIDGECQLSLDPIMAMCRERDVPVLLHTNEEVGHLYPGKTPNTMIQIYETVSRFPDNTIVLAHWGGGIFFYNLLKKAVKETLKNVWYDTAASPFLYESRIYPYARDLVGIDKVLLGTDYPLLKPARYFKEMREGGLTRKEMDAVCGQNAAGLLKLPL
ncbi:amidohydrolase family protein [uncultured Desulfosarcina sp.]|uniref:amidohydrolase family protein n=1 Tax=uncultured Desulfosarcina sp. TaxID=218289 RepID=UPI0029C79359|nr:amidohydrolase family protein [uncultured Desulfosarcina sp.]